MIENETWIQSDVLPCDVMRDVDGKPLEKVCRCANATTAQAIAGLPRLLKAERELWAVIGNTPTRAGIAGLLKELHDAATAMQPQQPDEFVYLELNADNWKDWHGKVVEFSDDGDNWHSAPLSGYSTSYEGYRFADDAFTPFVCARVKFRLLRVGEKAVNGDYVRRQVGGDVWEPIQKGGGIVLQGDVGNVRRYVEPA